jgi:hypothetical protein
LFDVNEDRFLLSIRRYRPSEDPHIGWVSSLS